MKFSKQSLSTDTRLSRSGIFNNSSLNNSAVPLPIQQPPTDTQPKFQSQSQSKTQNNFNNKGNYNYYMSNNIHNSQNKQVEFLRIKNAQLEQKNKRLVMEMRELQKNRDQILTINGKYVDVVNRYYQQQNVRNKDNLNKKSKQIVHITNTQAHRALEQLQKDHRNLVKHCQAMQQQIKNFTVQMQKFQQMKNQLKSVNHTSVQDLIQEIQDLAEENKCLRKNNNQITYQLQKSRQECRKIKKVQNNKEKQAGDSAGEVARLRSLIISTQQQSIDKANAYQARIYDLDLKVQKLEKQLRQNQQYVSKTQNMHRNLQIKQVQQVHEYQKLQNSVSDLLKSRQRALSLYSKSRHSNKNMLGLALDSHNKNKITHISTAGKNQRRSLVAEKSNIIS